MTANKTTIVFAIVYFAVILTVGWLAGKKTHGLSDFMIGGQKLGVWVTSFGVMAAVMSGWTWLGNPGTAYTVGYSGVIKFFAISPLGLILSYFILAKPIRLISSRIETYTLPDILAARWNKNRTIRLLSSLIILIGSMTYLVSQWSSMGTVMQAVLGVDYTTGVLVGALIISAYVVAGGMLASMWTNFIQMAIMFVMSGVLLFKTFGAAGGFTEVNLTVAAMSPGLVQPWWQDAAFSMMGVLSYGVLVVGLAYGGQPAVNTKFMMIRDKSQLRWSPLISVIALIVGTTTIFVGIAGIAMVQKSLIVAPEKNDLILTTVIQAVFSPTLGALIMVAVMAAVMSTAETYLFNSASSVVRDLAVQYFGRTLQEKRMLYLTRVAMVVVSVVTVALSLKPPAMISAVGAQAFGTFCAGFGPVLYLGLRWKRVTSKAAVMGMATGLLVGGILPLVDTALFAGNLFPKCSFAGIAVILSFIVTVITTLVTAPEDSDIFRPRAAVENE